MYRISALVGSGSASAQRSFRLALSILLAGFALSLTGCTHLNYSETDSPPAESAAKRSTSTTASPSPPASSPPSPSSNTAAPALASPPASSPAPAAPPPSASPSQTTAAQYGIPEALPADSSDEVLEWHDLTRLAREHRLQGEFNEANARLAQAALQLAPLPARNASRRTVFSQRARLARELFLADETESGELLADELFAEAEAGPAIGGASLVDLARDTIERRAQATDFDFSEEEELRLLSLAFRSAQTGTATRARVNLGFEVASLALHLDQVALARAAIDQSVLDARTTNPLDLDQEASLKVYKSRIALAQGDLQTAEAAATGAQRIFETIEANASSRGVGEAALADVFTARGETDRALELARAGYARIQQGENLFEHARRSIIGALGRAEGAAGLLEDAKRHYREALAIPVEDSALDERLAALLRRELDALN